MQLNNYYATNKLNSIPHQINFSVYVFNVQMVYWVYIIYQILRMIDNECTPKL